jgi:cell division protein ZapA
MANIDVSVAGRKYAVSCRDGEEDHLRQVAALVDKRARDAVQALGSLSEARVLLFAALMVADDLHEARSGEAGVGPDLAEPLERLALQVEALAERLEKSTPNP